MNKLKLNDQLNFFGLNLSGQKTPIDSFTGYKVISSFPAIHTKICDLQTKQIITLATEHPQITFISISTDSSSKQQQWADKNEVGPMVLLSDLEERNFINQTGLYINALKCLKRAVIILDPNNKVVFLQVSKTPLNPIKFKEVKLKLTELNL